MAASLIGFAFTGKFVLLCLIAIPLGLSSGAIDTGLSSFVALHYKAIHMNWLHAFWAVGASIGPLIMAFSLARWHAWQGGYIAVAALQFLLLTVLVFTIPRWNAVDRRRNGEDEAAHEILPLTRVWRLAGAKQTLIALFGFCGIEATIGLWGSTYLVKIRYLPEETAASWVSLYFMGIMAGRFLSGLLSLKIRNRQLITYGQMLIGLGIVMLFLPLPNILMLVALFLIGLGLAPVVPSMLHSTPEHFSSRYAQSMIGVQMASTFSGSALVPPFFGLIAAERHIHLFPYFLAALLVLMIVTMTSLYKRIDANRPELARQTPN